MVSVKVTSDTEIECEAPASSSSMHRDDEGRDNGDQGDDNGQVEDNDNENGEQEHAAQNCSSASLQPDTPVREAELKVSGAGATWDKVDLVTSTSSTETEGNDS
jgi:hypothetical protein